MASTARLDELKKKFDENPRRYFAPLANELRKSGDVEQAIALCHTHLPQQPAHISGHIVLGQALFEAGQLDESRETFHTALELDPENLIALRYLGDIARTGGDVPTARSWYQRVLEVDPRNEEIVQLVRDLDGAPAESATIDAEVATASAIPEASTTAQPSAVPASAEAPPAMPGHDDSRFVPLSIDQIDTDSELFAPTESGSSAPGDSEALDAHAAWSSESPTAEIPILDVPEIDPFDMPASATAESLFDAGASSPADHAGFFLDELATPNDPVDLGELDATPSEPAAPATEPDEAWGAQPSELEAEGHEAAPSAHASARELEESSFYLEPPPATPAWSEPVVETEASSVEPAVEPLSAQLSAAAGPTAQAPLQHSENWDLVAPTAPEGEAPNAPTAETDLVHQDTSFDAAPAYEAAHAQAAAAEAAAAMPASAADDGLGLEVMEFVPPTSSAAPSALPSQLAADPLVGHMPELSAPAMGERPDAFVTETMAELYLQQGFRNEALAVYRELLARNPSDTSLRERVEQIQSGSMSSLGMATLSENVVESARKRQTERPTRSVRSFFASLAGRRAPHPHPRAMESAAYDTAYDAGESEPSTTAESSEWSAEPSATASETQASDAAGADATYAQPDSLPSAEPPKSAAEQMATFDPFADAWEAPSPDATQPNDTALSEAAAPAEPIAGRPFEDPAPEARPAARSLEDLFPESSPTPRADAAAQTLATAFGRPEPQGRPTRAASNELSLDRVFRGAPEGPPPSDGGFSFDQFFSDSRTSGGDAATAPVASNASEGGSSSESGESHDIEQFTAWLEGLKKK